MDFSIDDEKQRESSPDCISGRLSVNGDKVFFCRSAIRVIWVMIVERIDSVMLLTVQL